MIKLKNAAQIALMKKAGRITSEALMVARDNIKPGVTTKHLDNLIRRYIEKCGARPSFLGYGGFPGSACISINEQVIHGIPSSKVVLQEGDIVKVDVGAFINGFHGDAAQSCPTLRDLMDCSLPGSSVHGFSRQECWSGVPLPSPPHI